jgi:ribonuclease-3
MPIRYVSNWIIQIFTKDSQRYKALQHLLGFTPGLVGLYESALCHRSSRKESTENNERLEFLGDAILGAIIGEHLFIKYPTRDEGYLTDMRSKIVNRKVLNDIALKIGMKELMTFNDQDHHLKHSMIFGNALEALIGAIYIDKGYAKTRTFIRKRILIPFIDIELLENTEINSKNKVIGWAGRAGRKLEFVMMDDSLIRGRKIYTMGVFLDDELVTKAQHTNKKEAGKLAADQAVIILNIL